MFGALGQWFQEPSRQYLVWASLISLIVGLVLGGWLRRVRNEKKQKRPLSEGDSSFFKGIQYLLSNDHDQAIEEFTKSVQLNSDTIETYVALGNLYRSKGDIDRAIRIRESIIHRPHIDEHIKLRALFDLGMDYQKGGFLNRALKMFLKVAQKNPGDLQTLQAMEKLYEELKDWENAYLIQKKIAQLTKEDHRHILAHHLVERGKGFQKNGDLARAKPLFDKAIHIDKQCVDAYLHLGDVFFAKQEYKKAIATWKRVVEIIPQFTFLAYRRLEGAYSKMKNLKPVEDFLRECANANSDPFTHLALARYLYNENDVEGALREIDSALEVDPSFWEARRFKGQILLKRERTEAIWSDYADLIERINMPYLRFKCTQCGFEPTELQWKCPQCNRWDTITLIDSSGAIVENRAQQT
ncbi:MAG: tetratricopeptide repeat protein [Deltaproteobacteria bacterium]|nr:tetratricopeptide repeat protein [Deltaproteobacteria bacterium]